MGGNALNGRISMKVTQNFLGRLFNKKKAIICFGIEFFQTGADANYCIIHNLDNDRHIKEVKKLAQKGLVFSVEQKSMHYPDQSDCIECLRIYGYIIGFWNYVIGTSLPSPKIRRWKISVSSGALMTSLLNPDIVQGRTLYESSEGKRILEMSGADIELRPEFMKFGNIKYVRDLKNFPIYEVSYLAMYDKACRFGFDTDQARNYAFIRANVYTFASLLTFRNEILMI